VGSKGHHAIVGNSISSSGNLNVNVAINFAGDITHLNESSVSYHPKVIIVV
jgi:hypothetical protein